MAGAMTEMMTILVVEDADEVRDFLCTALSEENQVLVARDGESALVLLSQGILPDLVLLDIGLPGINGYEVLERIKATPGTTSLPVIFLTGRDGNDDEVKALNLGAVDFIRKPVNSSLLLTRVRTHLELKKHRDSLEILIQQRTRKLEESEAKLKASVLEKEILLKEVHHRVKNNLQIVCGLLQLQSQHVKDPADLVLFQEGRDRIRSMALVHEALYRSGNFGRVNIREYIFRLTRELLASLAGGKSIRLNLAVEDLFLPVDVAIPCGLIVNELVTNALKHGFEDRRQGCIDISITRNAGVWDMTVHDDGPGFPPDSDVRRSGTLGMELVISLVAQLKGSIVLQSGPGATIVISFPSD